MVSAPPGCSSQTPPWSDSQEGSNGRAARDLRPSGVDTPRPDIHLGRRAGGPCRHRGPNASSVERTATRGRPCPVESSEIALSHHPHDRIADRRVNDAWLAAAWTDPGTRVLVLSATRFRPVDGRLTWLAPDDAPDGRRILLGDRDGVIHVAVIADPSMADGQDGWTGLRGAVQTIDEKDAELLVQAVGIAEWHAHPDRGAHVVLPEQLVGVDRQRRLAHAGALHRDRVAPARCRCSRACRVRRSSRWRCRGTSRRSTSREAGRRAAGRWGRSRRARRRCGCSREPVALRSRTIRRTQAGATRNASARSAATPTRGRSPEERKQRKRGTHSGWYFAFAR